MSRESGEFPKYLMSVNGKLKFLSFHEAYVAYDFGFVPVTFGCYVLYEDFSVHEMTDEDRTKISNAADEYNAGK